MHGGLGIIQESDKAQASGTLGGARVDLTLFPPRIAEDAFLGFTGDFVEINLLIRTGLDAVGFALTKVLNGIGARA